MNLDKLTRWLTLVSNVGILIGLLLVIVQLRQQQSLARATLYSDATTARIEIHNRNMDPAVAEIVAKSLTDPGSLSLAEYRVMDAFLINAVNEHRRRRVLERMGLRVRFGEPENMLSFYFGNAFAQAWWDTFASKQPDAQKDDLFRTMDQEIRAVAPSRSVSGYEQVRSTLNATDHE